MKDNTKLIMILIGFNIIWAGTTLALSMKQDDVPAMTKQNVVCDTDYGVQYFEYKGNLTLRVNHEGRPIRCYE